MSDDGYDDDFEEYEYDDDFEVRTAVGMNSWRGRIVSELQLNIRCALAMAAFGGKEFVDCWPGRSCNDVSGCQISLHRF